MSFKMFYLYLCAEMRTSMRIYVELTECEIEIVRQESGHSNVDSYIRNRTERLAKLLPVGPACAKYRASYVLSDPEAIERIEQYRIANSITRGAVVRRLAVDPLVLPRLLGGVPVF